jgi:hypothetical protein
MVQRRPPLVGLGVLAIAGLLLAGCSAHSGGSNSSQAEPAAAAPNADKNADMSAGGGTAADGLLSQRAPAATGAGGQNAAQLAPQLRSIIYSGSVFITATDVAKAANDASALTVGAGGNVAADNRTIDADRSEAQLTLRVPSDAFQSTMERLAKLGTELSRSVTTQDVTEDLVDVDARLATQQASVDRVRALLAKANTVGEIVSIESELTKREADLDSLEQRKTKLSGLVALSTITLNVRGTAAPQVIPAQPDSGFLAGLRSGWSAFLSSAKVFLTVAGWLLPWLIVIGIPLWLILRYTRRRRVQPVAAGPALVPVAAEPTPPAETTPPS